MAARTATRKQKAPPRRPARPAAATPKPNPGAEAATLAADLRDRAADVIDGARWDGAQDAAALIQAAEDTARKIRRTAAADARRVLMEAADGAGERLRRAEGDADTVRGGARDDAQTILNQARIDADRRTDEVMADAAEQAKALLADAEKKVSEVLAEAEERANALVDLRRTSAEAAYRTALDDAARIVGEAQDHLVEIKTARSALDSEMELTRRSAQLDLDEELAERRAAIDAELAARRAEIEATRAEIEADFRKLGDQHERARQAQEERLAADFEDLRKQAEKEAQAAAGGVRKEADELLAEANRELAAAQAARHLAEKHAASLKRKQKRAEIIKQGSVWVALAAVIVLTASGEWAFARMVGLGDTPIGDAGWALPLGLDVYAVTAFRMKKDVPYALGLMAATNITYHVADMTGTGVTVGPKGEKHPSVYLIIVAVLVVVAIVWRVHRLLEDDHTDEKPSADTAGSDDDGIPTGTGKPRSTATGSGSGNPGSTGTGKPRSTATGSGSGNPGSTGTGKPRSTATGSGSGNPGSTGTGKPRSTATGSGKPGAPSAEQRTLVRARATELIAAGQTPSPTALAAEFGGLDPEWVRNQIRAVRDAARR